MKSITIASQNFTRRVSALKLPYIDQVAGYYLFGGNAASSLPNLAYTAGAALTEISTPTYGAGYATISGTVGFETSLLLDEPFTQIVVGLQTVANTAIAMTARGTGNADNFVDMLRCSSVSPTFTADGWPDGNRAQSIDGLDASAGCRLYAQSWQANKRHVIFTMDGKTQTFAMSSVNIAKTTTPTHTLKFGTGNVGGLPVFRISAAVLAAKVLTMQQIFEIGIYLRALLATRGITML